MIVPIDFVHYFHDLLLLVLRLRLICCPWPILNSLLNHLEHVLLIQLDILVLSLCYLPLFILFLTELRHVWLLLLLDLLLVLIWTHLVVLEVLRIMLLLLILLLLHQLHHELLLLRRLHDLWLLLLHSISLVISTVLLEHRLYLLLPCIIQDLLSLLHVLVLLLLLQLNRSCLSEVVEILAEHQAWNVVHVLLHIRWLVSLFFFALSTPHSTSIDHTVAFKMSHCEVVGIHHSFMLGDIVDSYRASPIPLV